MGGLSKSTERSVQTGGGLASLKVIRDAAPPVARDAINSAYDSGVKDGANHYSTVPANRMTEFQVQAVALSNVRAEQLRIYDAQIDGYKAGIQQVQPNLNIREQESLYSPGGTIPGPQRWTVDGVIS